MGKKYILVLLIWSLHLSISGQSKIAYGTSAILQQLESLNTVGSALYLAAHPDDENTRLIAFLANGMHLQTGYLAATRGDGGQNLLGSEIRELLGVIRTQELLAARAKDGGAQFFSRANDFGYSKDPDETFNIWNKQEVLADFVWAIRKFKPDVLITRFSEEAGVTHGHHTASAILAMEAFKLSGDPNAFPEQLGLVDVWQPKKIFWNVGLWYYRMAGIPFDESGLLKMDVGTYNPYLGKSYTEISAESRSMHKSQGFGSMGTRGTEYEYFKQWGGPETGDLFGGIDLTWARIEGSEKVAYHLSSALQNLDSEYPQGILPDLLAARTAILKLDNQYWKEVKLKALDDLILSITGTFLEATAKRSVVSPGDSVEIEVEMINRSDAEMFLTSIFYNPGQGKMELNMPLKQNQKNEFSSSIILPQNQPYTNPYWLEKPGTLGMYRVESQTEIGLPQLPAPLSVTVNIRIDSHYLTYEVPVEYKFTDPIKGAVYQPLSISPPVMVNLSDDALVFADQNAKKVGVKVIAGKSNLAGTVSLSLGKGWKVTPEKIAYKLELSGSEQIFDFSVAPPARQNTTSIQASVTFNGQTYNRGQQIIDYDHIPRQIMYPITQGVANRINFKVTGKNIGYIMGAGDELPENLAQVGYQVTILEKEDVSPENLKRFDAVILGVRAFNTVDWLAFKNQILFEYAFAGGTVIVQYNTTGRLVTKQIAPFDLTLSRDRVSVEEAPVTILDENHRVFQYPNKIDESDFNGWVQERGLYFANQWDEAFVPVLRMNDPGESPKTGSLLIAPYGQGYYCYTGLSFFRELPAGVPGAYRLLANLIALGNSKQPK